MAISKLTPNLLVDDVLECVDFWCDVIGFDFVLGVAEGTQDTVFERKGRPLGFAMLQSGNAEVMFQSRGSIDADVPGLRPASSGDSFTLFIEVDDVEARYARIGKMVNLMKDLEDTFYGMREFHFRDPAGHIIGLAQRLPAPE